MEEKVFLLANKIRNFGGEANDLIDSLYRVLRLKELGFNGSEGEEALYNAMLTKVKWNSLYKGDARSFYETFNLINDFTAQEYFVVLNKANEMKGRSNDQIVIPNDLTSIMFSSITEEARSVFIPDCEKFGFPLYENIKKFPKIKFYTSSYSLEMRQLLELIYKDVNIEFINHEIYKENFVSNKFDLIICLPIIGARGLEGGGQFISKDSALIAAQNLLYHLTQIGKLSIILPAKVTFGGGDSEHFRDYINDNYKINEIFSLPNKIFYPHMSINTYLFSFSVGKTEDILIRKYLLDKNKLTLNDENERLLFIDEFEALNDWTIDAAFIEEDDDLITYREANIKKEKLQTVANVFRGKSVSNKIEDGNVSVVNISNINEHGIDYKDLDTIFEEERKISRYILEDGDVLITSRGTNVKIAVFKDQSKICIPSSNINVVRTDPKIITGSYLKLFLESKLGIKLLQTIQRGSAVVNINYQDIEMLEVPVPSLEKQNEIVLKYDAGLEKYKNIMQEAEAEWNEVKAEIQKRLF